MNDRQILNHLAGAVENDAPDMLDAILLRCGQIDSARQKGEDMTHAVSVPEAPVIMEFPQYAQKRKSGLSLIKWAATAAAMLIIAFGAWFGNGYFTVDSIIDFDVNPSIEIKINRTEKVLSATPLNADAEIVLDGMNLKNVDLDIAVNALIGSMLKNGYVNEIKNSILISVENADTEKGAELQKRLSNEVSSLLEAYSVGGAVLSQTVSEDEQLKALAVEHNISLGKAALVNLLVSQDTRLQFADIAALPINDITLLISDRQAEMQGVSMSGQASSDAYIGEDKAKRIALEHAGLSESEVTFIKARLDFDDGRMVYEVDFYTSEAEYEYELDALSGQIVGQDVDRKQTAPQNNVGNTSGGTASYIGMEKAKSIALNHVGLAESSVTFIGATLDCDDGRAVYDVEFYSGNVEYDYEIDAVSGNILEYDRDIENYSIPVSQSSASSGNKQNEPSSVTTDSTYIGEAKAKSIALAHAGLSESSVTFIKAKLDYDDGRTVYDVEFYSANTEYDYEIDAVNGDILEYDRDIENYSIPANQAGGSDASSYIGEAKAKSIALAHAGLSESEASRLTVKFDRDDGRMIYDVEFHYGNIEYEYEIDAESGQILEWDSDFDD